MAMYEECNNVLLLFRAAAFLFPEGRRCLNFNKARLIEFY